MPYHILLTIDVEDWFQVENLRSCCPVSLWPSHELRVERNTHRILDLFDEIKLKKTVDSRQNTERGGQSLTAGNIRQRTTKNEEQLTGGGLPSVVGGHSHGQLITDNGEHRPADLPPQAKRSSSEAILQASPRIRATFFVLGWIAERLPHLVREIHTRGHEVASHGYHHNLCSGISKIELRRDLLDSKKRLEDIMGEKVHGYRAPSFSVSDDILKMIADAGYQYDSSYNSFGMHGRYGKISLNGHERRGIAYEISAGFYELPISNLPFIPFRTLAEGPETRGRGILDHFRHFSLPWGGGAYFRLIPAWLFTNGVKEILRQQQGYLFYMHPWEVDPEQPRPDRTTAFSRFKHYSNLDRTEGKLRDLLSRFSECGFTPCHEYLRREAWKCEIELAVIP
jgi:peptidoglycan-N-acetylglucosamine deacetylase